jgi:hypothetical protein
MATVDLRTLPISEQHHSLAFNTLGRTGRNQFDFLWICPICDDGETYAPLSWRGGMGFFHVALGGSEFAPDDEDMHQLVAVDVIAVLESWRQVGLHIQNGTRPDCLGLDRLLALGAAKAAA